MGAGRARADADRPVVHPIYAHVPDAPQNDLAQKRFETAIRRIGLGALEIIDIEADPPPTAAEKLKVGIEATRKLDFAGALAALDGAANEVAARGGAGLDATALSDLFLYRGWATARADFNPAHVPEVAARTQAYADIARAAMVSPGRELNAQQFPPAMVEDWTRARADVRERAQGTLIVRAAPEALVSCDGGAPVPGPATFVGLPFGDHVIHVDEAGWASWGAAIALAEPSVEVTLPARRALTLDDATAAAHARRMNMKFALVAEPRPGQDGGLLVSLRLIAPRRRRRSPGGRRRNARRDGHAAWRERAQARTQRHRASAGRAVGPRRATAATAGAGRGAARPPASA